VSLIFAAVVLTIIYKSLRAILSIELENRRAIFFQILQHTYWPAREKQKSTAFVIEIDGGKGDITEFFKRLGFSSRQPERSWHYG